MAKTKNALVYDVTEAKDARCPHCDRHVVDMLSSEDTDSPWFYICWICRKVFHIGKGECERVGARATPPVNEICDISSASSQHDGKWGHWIASEFHECRKIHISRDEFKRMFGWIGRV